MTHTITFKYLASPLYIFNFARFPNVMTIDSYIVPSIWNGRQDWQKADLVDATDKKIIITLHNDQAKKQIEFLKNEAAIDKPLKEKDVTIGMDVLARISADMNKQPIYATGTITNRLRVSQYSVVPSKNESK